MINTTKIAINITDYTPEFQNSYYNIKRALVAFTRKHCQALDCFPSSRTERIIPMAMKNGFVTGNGIQTITPFHNYFYGTGKIFPADGADFFLVRFPEKTSSQLASTGPTTQAGTKICSMPADDRYQGSGCPADRYS